MDFEPVSGDDDLVDDQPEDRPLGLEIGILEPIPQSVHHGHSALDLLDGEISLYDLRAQLRLLMLHRQNVLAACRLSERRCFTEKRQDSALGGGG